MLTLRKYFFFDDISNNEFFITYRDTYGMQIHSQRYSNADAYRSHLINLIGQPLTANRNALNVLLSYSKIEELNENEALATVPAVVYAILDRANGVLFRTAATYKQACELRELEAAEKGDDFYIIEITNIPHSNRINLKEV